MPTLNRLRRPPRRTAPFAAAALAALLAAGCASAAATGSAAAKPGRRRRPAPMASCGSMPGMSMPACPASSAAAAAEAAASAGGVNPVPTQVLGVADWQGMKITAEAMTAVPFLIYNGTACRRSSRPRTSAST